MICKGMVFIFSIKYTQLIGKKSHIPQQIIRTLISIRNNIIYAQFHETSKHVNHKNKVYTHARKSNQLSVKIIEINIIYCKNNYFTLKN